MAKFDLLGKEEIERYAKSIRNEEKAKTFVEIINNPNLKINKKLDNNRIDTFERLWENSMTITRRRYGYGRNDTNNSFSKITSMLIKEDTFYKSSVLQNFENSEGRGVIEKFLNAEKTTYFDRTNNFLTKYGEETFVCFDGKDVFDTTLNKEFQRYKNGKLSKEELNERIEQFKEQNEEYMSADYKGKNNESNEAIIQEFMEI